MVWRKENAPSNVGGNGCSGRGVDRSVMQAIEELRAEVAALKQHEAEVVLSFDSTLQNVDARLKHMERKSLGAGGVESALVTNDRASGIGNSGLGVRR